MLHVPTVRTALAFLLAIACLPVGAQAPEYRANWADGFKAGFLSTSQVTTMMTNLRNARSNVIVPEIRLYSDAYYTPTASFYPDKGSPATIVTNGVPIICDLNSDPEPRKYGSYDPLAEIVRQGHDTSGGRQRVEVWPWLVSFRSKSTGTLRTAHPEWITRDSTGAVYSETSGTTVLNFFDPGHPGYEQQLYNVCMDLVTNYDIDGLNFDYIRFTASNIGYNDVSIARYNATHGTSGTPSTSDPGFKQWRRDQITNVLRKIYLNVIAVKPNVRISADTITWAPSPARPAAGDPNPLRTWKTSFSNTRAYYDVYQDWCSWLEEGIIDVAMPMNYFSECTRKADYDKWSDFAKDNQFGRQSVIGPAGYMNSLYDTIQQMKRNRLPSSPMKKVSAGSSNYSYAVPYAAECGGAYQYDPAGFANAVAYGIAEDPVALYPTAVPVPALPRLSNGKGHLMGTVTNPNVPSPGWLDGATVSLYVNPSDTVPLRTMTTDGTGFYGFVDVMPGTYYVRVSAAIVTAQTHSVTVTAYQVATLNFALSPPPPATQLAFTTQPGDAPTNAALSTQPVVAAKDAAGNDVPAFTGQITLTIVPETGTSGAVLGGMNTVTAVNGVAHFSGLSINKPADGYVLRATGNGLTAAFSASFDVTPAASRLVVTTQPAGAMVGYPLTAAPVISVQDDFGNAFASYAGSVSVGIKSGTGTPGSVLDGTTTVILVDGAATFAGLSINKQGYAYRLTATCASLQPVDTLAFDIATTAVRMAFQTQPGGAKAGEAFAVQPVLVARNAAGEIALDYQGTASLEIKGGTGAADAWLGGNTAMFLVDGIATYTDVAISTPGSGYVLTASNGSLPRVDSVAFNVLSTEPYTWAGAAQAASIAGGLTIASGNDTLRLDTDQSGSIDIADAARIARKVAGLEPNP